MDKMDDSVNIQLIEPKKTNSNSDIYFKVGFTTITILLIFIIIAIIKLKSN